LTFLFFGYIFGIIISIFRPYMETIDRFLTSEKQSFFLFGPRGTGKSTYVRKAFPDAFYLDMLLPDIFRSYNARPERLREVVHAQKGNKTIIIDEIQKAPQLLEVVHSLIEEKKRFQFVMTGSSARKLRRAGVNLLAGRALMKHMHPFMASELGSNFVLARMSTCI